MPAKTKKKKKKRTGLAAISSKELIDRLAEAARIGALFIEGEDVQNLLVPEAREWTDPDDINYDGSVGAAVKKTLLRIEQVDPAFPYHAILWRRRPDDPGKAEVMLAGSMNSSYSIGKRENPPIMPELRKVFDTGRPAVKRGSNASWERTAKFRFGHAWLMAYDSLLRANKRIVSYFYPIRDSREDVVAALELTCVGSDG
jgi:hypothetical protein